jgi:hypothetical protein
VKRQISNKEYRQFGIELTDAGVEAFSFTFG